MAQPVTHTARHSSRLVRLLNDYSASTIDVSQNNVADKLGQLFNLSDSISLADSLDGLARTAFEPQPALASGARQAFLTARQGMVEFIIKSFVPSEQHQPFRLPPRKTEQQELAALVEPYQKFYTLHQSEMDLRCHRLRLQTRQAIAAYSPTLAQLAALDKALGNTLAAHSRKLFATTPKLLLQRCTQLQQQSLSVHPADDPTQQANHWLALFHTEIQHLLLAELEVRLQPTLGLIEALDAEDTKQP
jgi:hypothetical protein